MKHTILSLLLLVAVSETLQSDRFWVYGQLSQADRRSDELAPLIKVLNDPQLKESEPDHVFEAIRRIGELRAQEAVSSLIALLSWRYKSPREREADEAGYNISVMQPYPAVTALFQIGEPALPALIKSIETNDSDPIASKNAAEAIMSIFREHPKDGICYLRKAAVEASTAVSAQRLNEAADFGLRAILPEDRKKIACPPD